MTGAETLATKVDILFQWGEEQGINVTYQAIEAATGITWTNVRKIRKGENPNPGLKTAELLARYFGVRLDYFECQTSAECWAYLKGLDETSIVNKVRMRANKLSPEALVTLDKMINNVLEFLDQVQEQGKEDESE